MLIFREKQNEFFSFMIIFPSMRITLFKEILPQPFFIIFMLYSADSQFLFALLDIIRRPDPIDLKK